MCQQEERTAAGLGCAQCLIGFLDPEKRWPAGASGDPSTLLCHEGAALGLHKCCISGAPQAIHRRNETLYGKVRLARQRESSPVSGLRAQAAAGLLHQAVSGTTSLNPARHACVFQRGTLSADPGIGHPQKWPVSHNSRLQGFGGALQQPTGSGLK